MTTAVLSLANQTITLKNSAVPLSQQYLSHLLDVAVSSPQDGQVITYNANTGKYVAAVPTFSGNNVNLDGGSF